MTSLSAYRQSVALFGLAVALVLARLYGAPISVVTDEEGVSILEFEKSELRRVALHRGGETWEFEQMGDAWRCNGCGWKPRQALLDRVAHQLHQLRGREKLEPPYRELQAYELGSKAAQLEVVLSTGKVHRLNVGALTPSGISHYVMVEGYDDIFIVKRAALEYVHAPIANYRSERPFQRDLGTLSRVEFTNAEASRTWVKKDEEWHLLPEDSGQSVLLDPSDFEESIARLFDTRVDFTDRKRGTQPCSTPAVIFQFETGNAVTFCAREKGQTRMLLEWSEDQALYQVPVDIWTSLWRDFPVGDGHKALLQASARSEFYKVRRGDHVVVANRSIDGWRWEDRSPVFGSTPDFIERTLLGLSPAPLPESTSELTSTLFLETKVKGRVVQFTIGRTEQATVMDVGGARYEVSSTLFEHLLDLVNEGVRHEAGKRERQARE